MQIDRDGFEKLRARMKGMETERQPWFNAWRDLANFISPRRFLSLQTKKERGRQQNLRNSAILDGTATLAAGTLAAGMMNGITSPARPWFRFRIPGLPDQGPVRIWLDEVQYLMQFVMAESNFYGSMAVLYGDLAVFQTGAMLIYEDEEDVFRCYNQAIGEFYFQQDERGLVRRFGREFVWRVEQVVNFFGLDNCSEHVRRAYDRGGDGLNVEVEIYHVIEPNYEDELRVARIFSHREVYWEKAGRLEVNQVLRISGYREWPAVTPRWLTAGNDSYGTGPSFDALGDVKQLQQETKRKAQALDYMLRPPLVAESQARNSNDFGLPGSIYYSTNPNGFGAKPVYQVNMPYAEISDDILRTQTRIRETYFNDLFRMISQLDTVRSAAEIDARQEEKLVLLGPVLERFQNEALDPALSRIFNIMLRRGLLPPPPPELAEVGSIEIQYVSILNDAQRAVGAAPIERYAAFIGNMAAAVPNVLEVPNWDELVLNYSERLGIPASLNKSREEIAMNQQARMDEGQASQMAELAPGLAQGAKNLAETPVGGGANALSMLLGGGV